MPAPLPNLLPWEDQPRSIEQRLDEIERLLNVLIAGQAQPASSSPPETSDGEWTVHTPYHWSRMVDGKRLNYWPTKHKFMLDGWEQAKTGDVAAWLRSQGQK